MENFDTISNDDKDVDLIIDGEKYYKINSKYYYKPNDFLAPIIKNIKDNSSKIKGLLRSSSVFISLRIFQDIFMMTRLHLIHLRIDLFHKGIQVGIFKVTHSIG